MNMDPTFFKPFLDGIRHTLKVQCHTEVVAQKPFLKKDSPPVEFDIAGIIGLASSTFQGSMTICFPNEVYLDLLSRMLGEKFETLTPELYDGAAELLNIIFGHAKRVLNDAGHDLQKAIPSVIQGKSMQTRHLSSHPVVILPFSTEKGIFYVEFTFGRQS